jgi:hypothetical protein
MHRRASFHFLSNWHQRFALHLAISTVLAMIMVPGADISAEAAQAIPVPPVPALNATLPYVVAAPTNLPPHEARPWFDHFSWQCFVALNWPALIGPNGQPLRGVPDRGASMGAFRAPRVWETWRSASELFRPDGTAPPAWDDAELGTVDLPNSRRVVGFTGKAAPRMDGSVDQAMAGALVDQNQHYVRYEIRLNQVYYDFVRTNRYYLRANLPAIGSGKPPVNMPMADGTARTYGVVEVKAAWAEMSGVTDPSTYYQTQAWIEKPGTNPPQQERVELGLVGLHIAIKTAPFQQWVWATFEHRANAPDLTAAAGGKWLFNDGSGEKKSPAGFQPDSAWEPRLSDVVLPIPTRQDVVQVYRVTPIAQTTALINSAYHALLKGTVWENYQLIATQWPTDPARPVQPEKDYPRAAGSPFPFDHVANTSMETYFQVPLEDLPGLGSSCLSCHYKAAQFDFSWALAGRAYPADPARPQSSGR